MKTIRAAMNITEQADSIREPSLRDGFLWGARDFARGLSEMGDPTTARLASGMLAGHALECALKAHLAGVGVSENKLRKLGHDLEALWTRAQSSGLAIDPQVPSWCSVLNQTYSRPHLIRYPMKIHGIQTPHVDDMMAGVRAVLEIVESV